MKGNLRSYIEITIAMIIVGSNVVVGKVVTENFPVFLASALRFAISSAILLAIVLKSEGGLPRIERREGIIIFLQAFGGNFLYSIFLLYGLRLTSAAESGIISGTAPAIVCILSYLFLRERLSWRKGAGIVLVVVGVIVINGGSSGATVGQGANVVLGNLLIVGSALGEGLWTLLSKMTSGKMAPLTIACLTSCFGFVLFLPIAIYQGGDFNFAAVTLSGWLALAYYGIVGTVGAYVLWYRGVVNVPASTAGVFTGIIPISAMCLSYIVLGEPFMWAHVIGMLCVILAIVLFTKGVSKGMEPQRVMVRKPKQERLQRELAGTGKTDA